MKSPANTTIAADTAIAMHLVTVPPFPLSWQLAEVYGRIESPPPLLDPTYSTNQGPEREEVANLIQKGRRPWRGIGRAPEAERP